jgi:exopolyphosphatase/guanosine-5'-triphosphate,3'-diphosphate pyrophosphatase
MTKVHVADVDLTTSAIVKTYLEEEIEVLFGADWRSSGSKNELSPEIQVVGLDAAETLLAKVREIGVAEISGVATEVFRKARNGPQYLERLRQCGLPVQLVAQEVEAELGFKTAISSGRFPEANVLAWDSGGASFQITAINSADNTTFQFYLGEFGSSVMTGYLVQDLRQQPLKLNAEARVNPVCLNEAKQMISYVQRSTPSVPVWIKDKVKVPTGLAVVGIGGPTAIFALASQICGNKDILKLSDVWSAIEKTVDKQEEELQQFQQTQMIVPKLCLLYAVMEKLMLPEINFQPALGCGPGLLIHPQFWSASS